MQLKKFSILFLLIVAAACSAKIEVVRDGKLSLNGTWKFHTIYGEGSNYMNVQETEEDIIIDNKDPNVEMQGNWTSSTNAITKFYRDDYRLHNFTLTNLQGADAEDTSHFRFIPKFEKSGYYEAFTRYPYASLRTVQYNIKHAEGITTKYMGQRTFCNEWNSLGIFRFDREDKNYVELTAIVSGSVAADAVMFREISEEKYLRAKAEPSTVFLVDFVDSDWYDLTVPGHWGMINHFSNYTGIGWYRKTFDLPQGWTKATDDRYYLKFDGVYHLSRIYLNGKFIGMNRGGFTPFEFDITNELDFDGKNVIAVQADNSAIVGATWNWGGIIRDVTLTKNKDVRIDYQYVHAEPDLKKGSATINLMVKIENNSDRARFIKIEAQIRNGEEITQLEREVEVNPNERKKVDLITMLDAEDVELWHFDNPKLYGLETLISESGTPLDQQVDNFGIRKVELTDSQMLLNGEPVRLAGFNRVSESRFWGSSEPLHVLEEDVDLMKEAGANFMRIMHGTQNEKLIELCDRKGVMLFEEVNIRDLDNDEFRATYIPLDELPELKDRLKVTDKDSEILMLDEPYVKVSTDSGFNVPNKNYFLAKYWLKGMIERDINHPSIIGWSVGNELNNHYEFGREAMKYVKELDPYRLVTCVSNSGHREEYTPETDPNTFVDLIMHNIYPFQGKPQDILNSLRAKWPDKPIFISEFGFNAFPSTAVDSDKEIFSEWTNNLRGKNEFVIGASMWTFNDYRSAYAGTTAEENRVWGIVTTWRDKRRLFDRIKKEHAPIKDIELTSLDFEERTASVRMPIRGLDDYPNHSMKNYSLVYQFRNRKGEVILKNSIPLVDAHPGGQDWSFSFKWDALSADVLDLTLSLMSPTGYSRLDKTFSFQKALTPQISQIIQGKNSVRILFDQVPSALEYFVKYSDGSMTYESYRTISDYLDLRGLESGKEYKIQLYAINNKGVSEPSEQVSISTGDKPLPPMIWDAFIAEGKLVIGYSSDFEDGNYTIQYGSSKNKLDQRFVSNVRGMVSIDLDEVNTTYFQMKREFEGEESNWSNVIQAKVM